jgi:hypothetical protein
MEMKPPTKLEAEDKYHNGAHGNNRDVMGFDLTFHAARLFGISSRSASRSGARVA